MLLGAAAPWLRRRAGSSRVPPLSSGPAPSHGAPCIWLTAPASRRPPHGACLTAPASRHPLHGTRLTASASRHAPHGTHLTAPASRHLPHGTRLTAPASRHLPHGTRLAAPASRHPPHGTCLMAPASRHPPHGTCLTAPGAARQRVRAGAAGGGSPADSATVRPPLIGHLCPGACLRLLVCAALSWLLAAGPRGRSASSLPGVVDAAHPRINQARVSLVTDSHGFRIHRWHGAI